MKKYFIVYEVVKNEEGQVINITNVFDFDRLKDVAKYLDIEYSNINKYVSNTTEYNSINARLKDNKYFIFKDYE